mmetsp:Transcript_57469/g.136655  ORF Transcript_57469/g.136655 Transcript_57469/m.136655 type:complete len:1476 (+) Transcript_57469:64-4491(+)
MAKHSGVSASAKPKEARQRRRTSSKKQSFACSILSSQQIFQECSTSFVQALVDKAEVVEVAEGTVVEIDSDGPLYVLEAGALEIRVGSAGQPVTVGPGMVLNTLGIVEFQVEQEPMSFRPTRKNSRAMAESARGTPYDILDYHGHPPVLFGEGAGASDPHADTLCMYTLCPAAARWGSKESCSLSEWLPLVVVGASPGAVPAPQGAPPLPDGCTARLLAINTELIRSLEKVEEDAYEKFLENCSNLGGIWEALLAKSAKLFPGAPPEIVWHVAEVAEKFKIEPGEILAAEGESGEAGEALYVIKNGVAMVEKLVSCEDEGDTKMMVIGRLRPGAIIGEVCLLGAGVPRSATVRARTGIEAIKIPSEGLVEVLALFPGMTSSVKDRLQVFAQDLMNVLPTKTEVLGSLRLFSGTDIDFIENLAHYGDRRVYTCGHVVIMEGSEMGALNVLEYGVCGAEVEGDAEVKIIKTGSCFGDRTFLGLASEANATIRVMTVFAIVLDIPRTGLEDTLEKHPSEYPHFTEMKCQPLEGRMMGGLLAHIELFRTCDKHFLEDLCSYIISRNYMRGQTIFVEGTSDKGQMCVLKGGCVAAERAGQLLAEITSGSSFGELSMLGLVRRRSVTIRAMTFCLLLEIPRRGFLESLHKFPGQETHFDHNSIQSQLEGRLWPCLRNLQSRISYLTSLHAEQKLISKDDKCLSMSPLKDKAILLLKGEAMLMNAHTHEEIHEMRPGDCFNEWIFIGYRSPGDDYIHPRTDLEVQVLSKERWDIVAAEFPDEKQNITTSIVAHLAEEAERKWGFEPKGTQILRLSALFRASSEEFVLMLRSTLQTLIVNPGQVIVSSNVASDSMYIVLAGECDVNGHIVRANSRRDLPIIGEAVLLGISANHPKTVTAASVCIVQQLCRSSFQAALKVHGKDKRMYDRLLDGSSANLRNWLERRLSASATFCDSDPVFVSQVCRDVEDVFFAPNEVVLRQGDPCALGETPFYLVLAGQMQVLGDLGVLAVIGPGEVFGEAGALGLVDSVTSTVRAGRGAPVHCARLRGDNLKEAVDAFPSEQARLAEVFWKRRGRNAEVEERRKLWIRETGVPALQQSSIFEGSDVEVLRTVASRLNETRFANGMRICTQGTPTRGMHILLDGAAQVESRTGDRLGVLRSGAVFGEVALLGLFAMHTATLRCLSACRVLCVPREVLEYALKTCEEDAVATRAQLERLVEIKIRQVNGGMPMCALPLNIDKADIAARAIALQAERVDLTMGEVWDASDAREFEGRHVAVLVRGSLVVELQVNNGTTTVLHLTAGNLLLETLVQEYGASMRALTPCELYRVRQHDLRLATGSVRSAQKWFGHYCLLEQRVRSECEARLRSAHGLAATLSEHPHDTDIEMWRCKRNDQIGKALLIRKEREDYYLGKAHSQSTGQLLQLPGIAGASAARSTADLSSMGRRTGPKHSPATIYPSVKSLVSRSLPRLPAVEHHGRALE